MITAWGWDALDRAGFALAGTLLSVLWQSTILLAAAAGLSFALRHCAAAIRHAVWAAALLAVPALPILGVLAARADLPRANLVVLPVYAPADPAPAPEGAATAPAMPLSPARAGYPWALALIAYVAGSSSFLALVLAGRLRLAAWQRRAHAATDDRVAMTFEAARRRAGVGKPVAVLESERIRCPIAIGWLRPHVLLPAGLAGALANAELEAVALHEMAHIRRGDPPVLALLSIVRALLFFHPLVWLACRAAAALAEAACDDTVLESTRAPLPYAKLLARLAESLPRRAAPVDLAAGLLWSKGAFLRRIEAILSPRRGRMRAATRAVLVATAAGGLLSFALALAMPVGEQPAPAKTGVVVEVYDEEEIEAAPPSGPTSKDVLHIEIRTIEAGGEAGRALLNALSTGDPDYDRKPQFIPGALTAWTGSVGLDDGKALRLLETAERRKGLALTMAPRLTVFFGQPASLSIGNQHVIELPRLPRADGPAGRAFAHYHDGLRLLLCANSREGVIRLWIRCRAAHLRKTAGGPFADEADGAVLVDARPGQWMLTGLTFERHRLTAIRPSELQPDQGPRRGCIVKERAVGESTDVNVLFVLIRATPIPLEPVPLPQPP